MTKEERKEYDRQRYLKKRDKLLEHSNQYRQEHKEYFKQYYQNNKDKLLEQQKKYRNEHKEYFKQYNQTPIGRAANILNQYKIADEKHKRGECDLTPKWIVDNIFSQPCHYCKKRNWHKIGCDRIDNSKPHTMDNVVPCCEECNKKRGTKSYEEFKNEA